MSRFLESMTNYFYELIDWTKGFSPTSMQAASMTVSWSLSDCINFKRMNVCPVAEIIPGFQY